MAYATLRHEDEAVSKRTGSRPEMGGGAVQAVADSSDFLDGGATRLVRSGSAYDIAPEPRSSPLPTALPMTA